MDLFSSEKRVFKLPNAELVYVPNFYNFQKADHYFEIFKKDTRWRQDDIKVFGKVHPQPRLTALYAENERPYTYSNITMTPKEFTKELRDIKTDLEQFAHHKFTSVLLNFYRDGSDSNGWHADNEKELGKNPIICSVSFGQKRRFLFKHRLLKDEKHELILEHGSMLLMKGEMQSYWLHHIPKTKRQISSRINLTFRTIK